MKAFSDLGTEAELLKLGRLLATLGLVNGEVMRAMKQAELESVMADMGEKVGTTAGKVNVPDSTPEATDKTLASREQQSIWRSWMEQHQQKHQVGRFW